MLVQEGECVSVMRPEACVLERCSRSGTGSCSCSRPWRSSERRQSTRWCCPEQEGEGEVPEGGGGSPKTGEKWIGDEDDEEAAGDEVEEEEGGGRP